MIIRNDSFFCNYREERESGGKGRVWGEEKERGGKGRVWGEERERGTKVEYEGKKEKEEER